MDSKVPNRGDADRPGAAPGLGMSKFALSIVRAPARSTRVAALCLGGTVLVAALLGRNEPSLAAATNYGRTDLDNDGLTDRQELVIGTLPYRADTDSDGFSDLEERARGSDPLDDHSVPASASYSVGTCASIEDGVVGMLSAVYLHNSGVNSAELEVGIVYQGHALRMKPKGYNNSRSFLYPGRDSQDMLAVVEVALPEAMVQRLGQVNLFSIVRGVGPDAPEPVVSVLTLVDFSGVTMVLEEHTLVQTSSGGGPTGVIYRPLTGGDQIPSTWSSGQICFQRTATVGVNGVSTVNEVEASDCLDMDTYCNTTDCAAAVGQSIELPDPAALIGG